MFFPLPCTTFLLCISCVFSSAEVPISEESNCSEYYSSDFSYGHFYKISELTSASNGELLFEFRVKTPSDAHIKFSERPFPGRQEPVYEVAIGAGKNTFSFLRRKEVDLSKIRLDTPYFLSSEEERGFWIRISKLGRIDVGKKGDVVPFMVWVDDYPLDIKYFSFSSWDGISAQWYFNCTKFKENDNAFHSKGTVSDLDNFFTEGDYDYTETEPPINPDISNYTNVYTHLSCNHVNLDDGRSILVVDGVLSLLWEDRRLIWSPEDYGNTLHLDRHYFRIWTPSVMHDNIADKELDHSRGGNARVRIYSNGTLLWKYPIHFSVFCKGIHHHNWPKDEHICGLQLGLMPHHSSLQMIPMKNGVDLQESITHFGWNIENVNVKTKWIPSPESANKYSDELKNSKLSHIIFEFSLTRSNIVYNTALIVSLATISTLTLLSFWVSPWMSMKMGLQCLSLVMSILSLLFCWKMIPVHNSKDLPSIFSAFIMTMHMVWVSIVSSVIISSSTFTTPVNLPSSVSKFLKSKFLTMLFCLPQPSNKVARCYNQLCDGSILNKEDSQGFSFKSKECESQWDWILISMICERILFCTYAALFIYVFSVFN